jgi:hypothetical protein
MKTNHYLFILSIILSTPIYSQSSTKVDWNTQIKNKSLFIQTGESFTPTNWTQTPGGTITAGVSKTVTVTPCAVGVAGSNVNYWVYISNGTGTAEAVKVTGGSCTSGLASGSLIFTSTYSHSGTWTIGSATGGVGELLASGVKDILLPSSLTLHAPVYIPNTGSKITGLGRNQSLITVASDFPLSGVSGVFWANAAEPGPEFGEFAITLSQPDSTVLSSYTHWAPVFYLTSAGRFVIRNVSVYRAWDGIVALGNAGGAIIDGLWMSAFHKGIQFDGSLDTVRISNFHFWPFGCTNSQVTTFVNDTSILGIEIGRLDDFKLSKALFINQKAIRFWAGSDGNGTFAHLEDISFDTYAQLIIESGQVNVANSYFNGAVDNTLDQVYITGGVVTFTGDTWFQGGTTKRSIYAPLAGANAANIQISNCRFSTFYSNFPQPPAQIEVVAGPSGASRSQVSLMGNSFYRIGAYAYTSPSIYINNAIGSAALTATIIGNYTIDQNSSPFIKINQDDFHKVSGNTFAGATGVYPTTKTYGTYQSDTVTIYGSAQTLQVNGLIQLPNIKANSGNRFICIDASGNLVSQTTACSGT